MISLFFGRSRYREPEIIHAIKNEKWVRVLNLLNDGANPNAKDRNGTAAIEIAVKTNDAIMKIWALTSRGAKIPDSLKNHPVIKSYI